MSAGSVMKVITQKQSTWYRSVCSGQAPCIEPLWSAGQGHKQAGLPGVSLSQPLIGLHRSECGGHRMQHHLYTRNAAEPVYAAAKRQPSSVGCEKASSWRGTT